MTDTFTDRRADQAATQDRVNAAADHLDGISLRMMLIEIASRGHAQYAQYDGYWSGPEWTVCRATRRICSKGGVQFERGDLMLVRPFLAERDDPRGDMGLSCGTAYSVRLGWNCAVVDGTYKPVAS